MKATASLSVHERIEIGLEAGESHFREFKSALSREGEQASPRDIKEVCRDIAETLVSFANADGGELVVGVEDDAAVTGVPHDEKLIEKMKRAFREYVHPDTPLPPPIVAEIWLGKVKVLYFSTPKSVELVHLTSDGRCLRRSDRENKPVAPETIQHDRRQLLSRTYDREFVDGATTGDIDLDLVSSVGRELAPGYSPEKVLQYLGVSEYAATGLRYRRGALLLFAKDVARWHPRCSVRIVRVNGTELGVGDAYNVIQDDLITSCIVRLLEQAWDALRPHLARTMFQATGLFKESFMYPETACREALVNAVAHRDYSREGSHAEVFIFDDRMEFRSPGGLVSSISVEDLRKLKGVHESRNTAVARVLRELGYMREMGEGIPRMFRAMRDSDLVDPELRSEPGGFHVVLQHRSTFTPQDIEWLEGFREFDLTKNEQRVVLLGRDGHLLSTNQILEVTGFIDIDDFRALYDRMRRKGLIYSQRARGGAAGRQRDVGRFRVRSPRDLEEYFGELLAALRTLGPTTSLGTDAVARIRERLLENNPYRDHPEHSLQALGLIDVLRRVLPKAVSYVPELGLGIQSEQQASTGIVVSKKPAGYGFIRGDDGADYFFHATALPHGITWNDVSVGARVRYNVKASSPGQRDAATDLSFD